MFPPFKFPVENFAYSYLKGPLESPEMLDDIKEGNCRLASQLYYYRVHKIFLQQDEIYLPGGYKTLGTFIFEEEPIIFEELKTGDILYAQNLRDKNGVGLQRSPEMYTDKDEWLYHFHSAIYIGEIDGEEGQYVWHATNIEGGTALWTLEKFQYFYKPISAKRVV